MMSKTHLAIGTAASLAVTMPSSTESLFTAIIGGCVGGILCDIECKSTRGMRDALYGRIIAAAVTVGLLLADRILNTGICLNLASRDTLWLITGAVILLVTGIVGRFSAHRTFTHSLFYIVLITVGFYFIIPNLVIPVLSGGISHLVIDTFNKMPVPWLYPLRKNGFCFKLCYANRIGNAVLMWVGFVACIGLITWRSLIIAGVSIL